MSEIGWGIVGAGSVATSFADGLRHARDARLRAVAGRSPERVRALAAPYGATAHDSLDALLADPSVDVVYLATPNAVHVEQTLAALAAGKPVLCEKPLAPTAAEAERVAAAATEAGLFCAEAMWMRCSATFRQVVTEVRAGAIGQVRSVDAQLGFAHPQSVVDTVLAPEAGGALLDLAVYPLTLAQAVAGEVVGVPAAATSQTGAVEDSVRALLRYRDGVTATIAADVTAELSNSATISGTDGVITIPAPLTFPTARALRRYSRDEPSTPGAPPTGFRGVMHRPTVKPRLQRAAGAVRTARATERHLPRGTGYTAEADEVGRCLREGRLESNDLAMADTIETLRAADAIREVLR